MILKSEGKNKRQVYLDHAAATPLDPAVFSAMQPFFTHQYANPSGLYASALETRKVIDESRKTIADFLHTTADTVIFTSGGTESCNGAVFGLDFGLRTSDFRPVRHIITTAIEHKAVLGPIRELEKRGFDVTYLPVDENGIISVADFKKALRIDTVLVSIMYANNEIGSIQPIADIGREILKWRKEKKTAFPYFHIDACQATQFLPMSVEALHVDLLSFNGSKIYGPKGAGVLYKRRGVPLKPLMHGGGQEFGLRSGTEDVASIVGLGKAVEQGTRNKKQGTKKMSELTNTLWIGIKEKMRNIILNGPPVDSESRLPNNFNVSFLGAESEALILYFDAAGIAVSSGSACDAGSGDISHVLKACGYDDARVRSSVRFTLGKETTEEDIQYVLDVLPGIVEKVRKMNSMA